MRRRSEGRYSDVEAEAERDAEREAERDAEREVEREGDAERDAEAEREGDRRDRTVACTILGWRDTRRTQKIVKMNLRW